MVWTIYDWGDYYDVYKEADAVVELAEEEIARIGVSFKYSGTAIFYSSGDTDDSGSNLDTIGYLSTYAVLVDEDTGEPLNYVEYDDDSGDGLNFRFEYEVEAGEMYYVYFRHLAYNRSGAIQLTIVPPEGGGDEYYQPSYDNISVDVSAGDSSVTVHVSGFDTAYDDVWKVTYGVTEKETGTNIVNLTLRSDNDLSFNNVTFDSADGILPGTTYQVLIMLVPYPDDDSGCDSWITWDPYEVTTGGSSSVARPAKFTWADGTTKKAPKQEFDITADEWCDLLDNINAVRVYKGYSEFTKGSYAETYYYNYFTYPSSGDIFRYQHYNQALNAITGILGDGYSENEVQSGWPVTADCLNLLVEMINSVE